METVNIVLAQNMLIQGIVLKIQVDLKKPKGIGQKCFSDQKLENLDYVSLGSQFERLVKD
jgi:hypothetical protein